MSGSLKSFQSYLVIMSERLQQGGEVVEVDLLQAVLHCTD